MACTRHLKQNTESCGGDLAGLSASLKQRFVNAVFGDTGLTSCADVAEFECAVDRLRAGLLSDVPEQLRTYFNNRCIETHN